LAPVYIEEPVIEPVNEPDPPEASDIDARFGEFWSAYPNKVEARGARAVFERLVSRGDATPDELVGGTRGYAALVRGREPRFIKTPTSWLAKGCWADSPPPDAPACATAMPLTFAGPDDLWATVARSKGPAGP
jgi:hypothetical protein